MRDVLMVYLPSVGLMQQHWTVSLQLRVFVLGSGHMGRVEKLDVHMRDLGWSHDVQCGCHCGLDGAHHVWLLVSMFYG